MHQGGGVAASGQARVHGRWCGSVALQRAAFLARFRRLMFPHDTSPEHLKPETLAETIESVTICITDLFQNKSVAYF